MSKVLAASVRREWPLCVDGSLVPAEGGRTFADESPVTEEVIAQVPDASEADVDRAVAGAERAFDGWRLLGARGRARLVRALAGVLRDHADEMAALDAVDGGNPVTAMRGDVAAGADALEMFAGWALSLGGDTVPASPGGLHYTVREPYGVVARIVAFNHPVMFAASKVAAPLVAGNTVVLKPSEVAPLSAMRFAELAADVLPPGVLSVVVGDGPEVGRALVRHPVVRRVGFIGAEPTGRAIQRDAAETGVKDVTLELGGKNAMVVCADADLERVADGAVAGMNFAWSQGQSCGSTSRLLVHESVADQVLDAVVARVEKIRVGSPLDPATEMGTLASRAQYAKTLRYIDVARDDGARLVAGGGRPAGPGLERGLYVAPTVFADVAPHMRIAREEVFGPVLSVLTWRDEDEALRVANEVRYGLTASIWTRDLARAHRLAGGTQAGYVWVNGSSRHFPGMPFGGYKSSGVGREESIGELLSYTQLKAVNVLLD
ncbi:MAG: aldehyde dehydrogenase family protein [Streptosporangiaceae bacterium]